MSHKIERLIERAQAIMRQSTDPIHDLDHGRRVAAFAETLANDLNLSPEQRDALVLAAWWHDASRTLTKKPSIVWMAMIDDILSALMLWRETIRLGVFGSVVGMATRMIFCKSLGTGALLTRLFMRKKNRILVDLIKDADMLDILTTERFMKVLPLVESSRLYRWGYRTSLRWLVSRMSYLRMKTEAARKHAIRLLRTFLEWVREEAVYAWHVAQFGHAWCQMTLRRGARLLRQMEAMQIRASSVE